MVEVSLDGGLTFIEAPNGVRMVVREVAVPEEYEGGALHLNVTSEGLVSDLVCESAAGSSEVVGTGCTYMEDLAAALFEKGA